MPTVVPTRVLIAPSGFKESLSASEVGEAIAVGVRRVLPGAQVEVVPIVDGGEGSAEGLAEATGGRLVPVSTIGPVGQPVEAHVALLGGDAEGTAALDMASAAGLRLVPKDHRDPTQTTTYGVGELLRTALDQGSRRLLVGCGDSGTSDGGAGALQALGARLLDADGQELGRGGQELLRIDRIDLSGLDPRIAEAEILVACNQHNVLTGDRGVARVFGPQKGATPEQVDLLSEALERWAGVLERDCAETLERLGLDIRTGPGTGASGGLGAGLAAGLGARLRPRFEVLLDHVDLDALIARADLVLTAEGAVDSQTAKGKVPAEVGRRSSRLGKPVIVMAGTIGAGAAAVLGAGVDAYTTIVPGPITLEEAVDQAATLVADATERTLRLVLVGAALAGRAG